MICLTSIEPQNGPERQFAHHRPLLVADDEAFSVDRLTQSDLLRQYLPRGIDGFLVGNLYRGEFGANPVLIQLAVASDVEIELWHAETTVFSGPNPCGHSSFHGESSSRPVDNQPVENGESGD